MHGIVPGGGLGTDGKTWVACRPGFFLLVRVLSRLFRRRFLEELQQLHDRGKLDFLGQQATLADAAAFRAWLAPLRKIEWVVYAKRPFAGPQAVLTYLSRYTQVSHNPKHNRPLGSRIGATAAAAHRTSATTSATPAPCCHR